MAAGGRDEMTDDEQKYDEFEARLRERFGWQFRADSYIAVGPGWFSEVERVCEFADQLITDPRDRALFGWVQIKEKLGGLRMFADTSMPLVLPMDLDEAREYLDVLQLYIGPERLSVTDEPRQLDAELTVHQGLRDQLWARSREAERVCDRTCEVCGSPGKIYREGWHTVLCPEHLAERKAQEAGDA